MDITARQAFWTRLYENVDESRPYGDNITYERGATFIGQLPVEDWGCGLGWYRRFAQGPYCGIDGSPSKFCDEVADLCDYRSQTPALFMRHVLEHNEFGWKDILDNAVASFQSRMVLVIFTPFGNFTQTLKSKPCRPPDISFRRSDLTNRFGDVPWGVQTLYTETQYGVEHVFYLEKTTRDND